MNALDESDGPSARLLKAVRFAAEKHSRQRRKDSEATPYINHPIAVAEVLARVGKVTDGFALQAALLHDTLEDTPTTAEELEQQFGPQVCALVREVTDDKSLPQPERRRLQLEQAAGLSTFAKQIRMADKICNVSDITTTEPARWTLENKRDYLTWAEQVVVRCRGSNPDLEGYFDELLKEKSRLLSLD